MILVGGAALVVAVHPDPFGGWGLLALGPLLFLPAYALVFRTPPRGRRVAAASVAALAYALVYGVVAGLGDESLREVKRAVYVGLPALGLVVMLVCLAAVELAGAMAVWRQSAHHPEEPRGDGEIWLEYDLDGGSNGGGAELLEPGTSEVLVRAPEQSLGVACTKRGDGTASKHATMTVVRQSSASRG